MDEIWKILVTYGPGGVIAGLVIVALIAERKDHKADNLAYDAEIKFKDDLLIETLNKWRADTQLQADKIAGVVEKTSAILDAQNKRSDR